MLAASETSCPFYGSSSLVIRFGTSRCGSQKFRYKGCTPLARTQSRAAKLEKEEQIVGLLAERLSQRGIARVLKVSHNTIREVSKKAVAIEAEGVLAKIAAPEDDIRVNRGVCNTSSQPTLSSTKRVTEEADKQAMLKCATLKRRQRQSGLMRAPVASHGASSTTSTKGCSPLSSNITKNAQKIGRIKQTQQQGEDRSRQKHGAEFAAMVRSAALVDSRSED